MAGQAKRRTEQARPAAAGDRAARRFPLTAVVLLEVTLIFAVLVVQGGGPVPEVNEPNYLTKAKNYWDPQWCGEDFFLGTADTHLVFYWAFGWLSLWLPLPVLAWTGRLLTWALMAAAWQRLSWAIVPRPFCSVLTAALFVLFNERYHMAGEWIVGGVEAKGFAYALLMMGLAAVARNRWRECWLWLGAASSFHVLVGGWAVVATGVAWLLVGRRRIKPLEMVPALVLGLLLALPGLVAALLTTTMAEPQIVDRAARIQVFHRLPHHLNPARFWFAGSFTTPVGGEFGLRFLAMGGIFAAFAWRLRGRARARRVAAVVAGAVAICAAGILLALLFSGNESRAAAVLKYYWFRLSDAVVPMGLALLAVSAIMLEVRRRPRLGNALLAALLLLCCWHLGGKVIARAGVPAPLDRIPGLQPHLAGDTAFARAMSPIPPAARRLSRSEAQHEDWIDICLACRQTHPQARFLTPMHADTFKWYSGRSEVVNWKEMPQDAPSIDEWWKRVRAIHRGENRWRRSLTELTSRQLRQLGGVYQAHYLVTEAEPRLDLTLIYRNNSFALYQLAEQPAEGIE